MNKLTENQKYFILSNFFNVHSYHYENRKSEQDKAAETLLMEGKCILGGLNKLFTGPAVSFIETKQVPGVFDALEYTFDLEGFLNSPVYKERAYARINQLKDSIKEANKEIKEIELIKDL